MDSIDTDELAADWADYFAGIRVARDEQRYGADGRYRHAVDLIDRRARYRDHQRPVMVEFVSRHILWIEAEDQDAANRTIESDAHEFTDECNTGNLHDSYLNGRPLDEWEWDEGAYSVATNVGPKLPNDGFTLRQDRIHAEYAAYREAERRGGRR